MRFHLNISLLIVTVFLASCVSTVKKVDYDTPQEMPEDAHPIPIKFSGIELLLPPGMDIGYEKMGRSFCTLPRYPVNRNALRKEIDHKYIRQTFHDALVANGYDVVSSLDVAFDPEEEEQRAEYSVKGKVKDVHVDMCHSTPEVSLLFPIVRPGTNGELYTAIDWSVYDLLRRHVVFKTRTEGYTKRRYPNQEGLTLMFQDAFEMAAHNLAANEEFYDLIVNGIKPENQGKPSRLEKRFQDRPRQYDPREEITLPVRPLSRQPFAKTIDEGRKIAVTIQKIGHGSGFFISEQGHILTNAHVVGDAQRIRIITANKKDKLIAEVLRVEKARDVALLKLEEIPPGLDIVTLPIRTDWPNVGEDVYAIGTPMHYSKLQDTVTKGIVSAHRKKLKLAGLRENYIQADVDIHGGNSGGPLLDEYGNIIGISVIGLYMNEGKRGIGLNLFVPIGEALERLDIKIGEGGKPAQTENFPLKLTP